MVKRCITRRKLKKVGIAESLNENNETDIDNTTGKTKKKTQKNSNSDEKLKRINEKLVRIYISSEKNKPNSNDTIIDEYTLKVILFGYITVNIEFSFI